MYFMNNSDKRDYERMFIQIPCVIYTDNGMEFECITYDISENGIQLRILNDKLNGYHFERKQIVKLLFTDELGIYSDKDSDAYIVSCDIIIVRISSDDKTVILGCNARSPVFADYVFHKKFAAYFKSRIDK